MKRFFFLIPLFIFAMLFLCSACKNKTKVEPPLETDPAIIILGKWELIEMGNGDNMISIENPGSYKEYLSDSILREYNYETGEMFYQIYWIDTLLNERIIIPNGPTITSRYRYKFKVQNTEMELEFYNTPSIFTKLIFIKIK